MESSQLSFQEVDGQIVIIFNEAEALADENADELTEEVIKKKTNKRKGKCAEDFSNLPKEVINHDFSEDELKVLYPDENWKRLPDEVYHRYSFTPAKIALEEHHVAVYSGKKTEHMEKAKHPAYLLRESLVSPSLETGIITGKYVNAAPFARLEKLYQQYNVPITRQNMANWTILCAERYLSILYDYLHKYLYRCHVIQADEIPLLVNKDGRPAGSKSYMWVYRTGKYQTDRPVVLYDYQKTRKTDHP